MCVHARDLVCSHLTNNHVHSHVIFCMRIIMFFNTSDGSLWSSPRDLSTCACRGLSWNLCVEIFHGMHMHYFNEQLTKMTTIKLFS